MDIKIITVTTVNTRCRKDREAVFLFADRQAGNITETRSIDM